MLSIEVHTANRGDLKPDPEVDAIEAIFYSIFNDIPPEKGSRKETGVMIVDAESANQNQDDISTANQSSAKKRRMASPRPGTSGSAGSESGSQKAGMTLLQRSGIDGVKVIYVKTENELLEKFIEFVHK